jgi:hypothetical protein
MATMETAAAVGHSTPGDGRWCIGSALLPHDHQLLMEGCLPPRPLGVGGVGAGNYCAYVTVRMEQMDQLWHMDGMGYVRSLFNQRRCMTVTMSSPGVDGVGKIAEEAPVVMGLCVSWFILGPEGRLRLRPRGQEGRCITFLWGGDDNDDDDTPTWGSPVVLGPCPPGLGGAGDRYGWDLVPGQGGGASSAFGGQGAAVTPDPTGASLTTMTTTTMRPGGGGR